jgi:membrane protease YdiL (CAAX protease family)
MEKRTVIAGMVLVGLLFAVNVWGLFQYGYRGPETIVICAVPVIAGFVLAFYYIKAKNIPPGE